MLMRWGAALLCLLIASGAAPALGAVSVAIAKGARVGIVNLLDPEVMHFHQARRLTDSFLKSYTVGWRIDVMLANAARERLQQLGLVQVPVDPSNELLDRREDCIVDANLSNGLVRDCVPAFVSLAAAHQLDALIVLGPGLNNSRHGRQRDLPAYLRGWGFATGRAATPTVFNMTELLFIGISGNQAQLLARAWGGADEMQWSAFVPPPDLKSMPQSQIDQLQPLFQNMLTSQCSTLLDQIEVSH